jgi:hypothetical protein
VLPVGTIEEQNEELKIAAKLKKVDNTLGCAIHARTYCLIPNKMSGPIFMKYGLDLEHLRITDTEHRAWAEELHQ